MIAKDSTGYPFLALAQHNNLPYGDVLKVADLYAYVEFDDGHLASPQNIDRYVKIAEGLPEEVTTAIHTAVCDFKRLQGHLVRDYRG